MLTPMAKITPLRVTEEFEHFVRDLRESFWGDVYGQTRLAWKRFWEAESMRERDSYMKTGWYDRADPGERADYRNGFYQRDFVTRLGTIRLRIARTRGRNFLPPGLEKFQRRAEDVAILIREAFLRGISTRQAGRIVATFTGEPVSAQTVSKLVTILRLGSRAVSYGGARRRMGLSIFFGWSQFADAPAGGTKTGAYAGGLCGPTGWNTSSAGLSAQ